MRRNRVKVRRKFTHIQKAWKLLKICREGKNPALTADHPNVKRAADIVGVNRAITFLKRPIPSKDLMTVGKRIPGSAYSRK